MSFPSAAVDRLFARLAATYGREWVQRWEGLDDKAVKALWGHELEPWGQRLEAIAWALENLPERAPNAVQFRNLCRQAPAPAEALSALPPPNPERMKQEMAKLGHSPGKAPQRESGYHKAWAHRIVARHQAGEKITPTVLKFATEVVSPERVSHAPQ